MESSQVQFRKVPGRVPVNRVIRPAVPLDRRDHVRTWDIYIYILQSLFHVECLSATCP